MEEGFMLVALRELFDAESYGFRKNRVLNLKILHARRKP